MKSKGRGDEPHERRSGIDCNARKISEALKVFISRVAPHPQPVVHGLQGHLYIFRGFQFNHDQPALARAVQQVQHSAIAAGKRRHLRREMIGVEHRIELRWASEDDGFEPTFGLRAEQPVICVGRERATVQVQILCQLAQARFVFGFQSFEGFTQAKNNSVSGSSRKFHPIETERDFSSAGGYAQRDRALWVRGQHRANPFRLRTGPRMNV